MILNTSKIKTEALLLFCKDIILSYNLNEDTFFNVDNQTKEYINTITSEILVQLQQITKPNEYYLKKQSSVQIRYILNAYNFLNKNLSKELVDGKTFNPSMLYISLMGTWFAELGRESKSKEFIYFSMYPYAEIFDKLLVNINDPRFKALNIAMVDIAERIIFKFDRYNFK